MTVSVRIPNDDRCQGEDACSRECPTLPGDSRSLIVHRIDTTLCMGRQREHYHKCHRCLYRGKPASYVAEERIQLMPVAETGLPTTTLEIPALGARR